MVTREVPTEETQPQIVATDVSVEDYLENYAAQGMELVEGVVIKMPPIGLRHEEIRDYLRDLFRAYFSLKQIGRVFGEPFVMRLPAFPNRRREPDLIVVLHDNPHELKETFMDGPANICIEIVSPATVGTDHGDKFSEYEQGGVPEYWIIDPIRNEARFYRLSDEGVYLPQSLSEEGKYSSPQLPQFNLDVAILWQETLPDFYEIASNVREMAGQ